MSTGNVDVSSETAAVVLDPATGGMAAVKGLTREQAIAQFGAPPTGMNYRTKGGFVVMQDGRPVTRAKKNKTRGTGVAFAVPADKFGGWEAATAGFDTGVHNKLKPVDFSDPLDFLLWEVWYFNQRAAASQKKADSLLALGKTKEERSARSKDAKVMDSFDSLVAKAASGQGSPEEREALKQKLKEMYEALTG